MLPADLIRICEMDIWEPHRGTEATHVHGTILLARIPHTFPARLGVDRVEPCVYPELCIQHTTRICLEVLLLLPFLTILYHGRITIKFIFYVKL